MPETQKMHPVGELFSQSWRTYKERFAVLFKIALIPALFLALANIMISQGLPAAALGGLFELAGVVLALFASIAALIAVDQKTDFNESYRKSTPFFWPYIWVSILTAVAMIGGFVMLVVPGIILVVALALAKYIVILENRRGLDALTQSRAYAKGYWWALLGRIILLGLCFGAILLILYLPFVAIAGKLVGAIVYAALLLFLTPFSVVYTYHIYKNLVALKPELAGKQTTGSKTFLIVSAVVGIVAPIVIVIGLIILLVLFAKPYWERNPQLLQQLQQYQYQYEHGLPITVPTSTTGATTSTGGVNSSSSPVGMHCGGFIRNAPTCPSGYHCQLNLRYPDTGGVCVAD